MICTDSSGAHVVLSNTCTTNEYGDQFDVMGCCTPSLFSNINRINLGSIPYTQISTITQSGSYAITPAGDPTSLVYGVPDGSGNYIYFENRAAAEPPTWPNSWSTGNLLVRWGQKLVPGSTFPFTNLLDCSPADNDTIPNAKGCPVGSSFTLPNGATVTNQSFDGTNNIVSVTF
jgi:hypothetical protein